MAFADTLKSLNEFNLGDLDFDNLGSWPLAIKILTGLLLLGRQQQA